MYVYKYLDQKGSIAVLAIKRSVDVVPEVNLNNPLHKADEVCKRGIHPRYETQGKHHQKSKIGTIGPTKRMSSKNF